MTIISRRNFDITSGIVFLQEVTFRKINFCDQKDLNSFKNTIGIEDKFVYSYIIDNSSSNIVSFGGYEMGNLEWIHVKNIYIPEENQNFDSQSLKIAKFNCVREFLKYPNFSSFSFPPKRFKVDMFNQFDSDELFMWNSVLPFSSPITIKGLKVVHGKKVGRTLGIPTGALISQPAIG
jgi:hypothetical protein